MIPNWEHYQASQGPSKKGWKPPWIKVQVMTGDDFKFSQLSYEERGFLTELWKLAARTNNMIPEQTSWIANATQRGHTADAKKIPKLVEKLLFAGLLSRSRTEAHVRSGNFLEQRRVEESRGEESRGDLPGSSNQNSAKKDDLWDTLVEILGFIPQSRPERGSWNNALKQLREAGATPQQIRDRAAMYGHRWPGVSLTPTALAKHWGSLSRQEPAAHVAQRRFGRGLTTAEMLEQARGPS